MEVSNKEVLQSMLERRAETLLNTFDELLLPLFDQSPALGKVAINFITIKKKEYLPKIQEYCDLLVETACLDPSISLKEAIDNAEDMLNEFMAEMIESKLHLPTGTIRISLGVLFADKMIRI